MNIQYEEYMRNGNDIIRKSDKYHKGWFWAKVRVGQRHESFLRKRVVVVVQQKEDIQRQQVDEIGANKFVHRDGGASHINDSDEEECTDDSLEEICALDNQDSSTTTTTCKFQKEQSLGGNSSSSANSTLYCYDIVYCTSYKVPILYFTAHHESTGRCLLLDQVWDNMESYHSSKLYDSRYTVLTQVEHPLTGKVCFQLHPCYTTDMMYAVYGNKQQQQGLSESSLDNYVLSWLSLVGPVVGLNVSTSLL